MIYANHLVKDCSLPTLKAVDFRWNSTREREENGYAMPFSFSFLVRTIWKSERSSLVGCEEPCSSS